MSGKNNILWNIRYSNLERDKAKLTTILIIKVLALLSYFVPRIIITVSKRAKKIYEIAGYNSKIIKYIPNGYDLSILRVNETEKINFRKKINYRNRIPLIGNVARFDPQKDHLNLLKALNLIKNKKINFKCIFVGFNVDNKNIELLSNIKKLKLSNHIKLLGQKKYQK